MTDNNTALKKAGLKVTLPRLKLTQQHHHDHLICLDCGKVIEFSDDSIEARQREIAAKHGIRLTNHSLYLYGHCAEGDCREDEHAHEGK